MSVMAMVVTFLTVLSGIGFVISYSALDSLAKQYHVMTPAERKALPAGKALALIIATSIFAGWLLTAAIVAVYQLFLG